MKFRYLLKSVCTDGGGIGGAMQTEVVADVCANDGGGCTGTLKLRFDGNQYARFRDAHGAPIFNIPLPDEPADQWQYSQDPTPRSSHYTAPRTEAEKHEWRLLDVMLIGLDQLLANGWIDANSLRVRIAEIRAEVTPKYQSSTHAVDLSCGHPAAVLRPYKVGELKWCHICGCDVGVVTIR